MSNLYHVVGTLDPSVAESMAPLGNGRVLVHDDERDQVLVAEPRRNGGAD